MECLKCNIDKSESEYFYIDGGLNFTNEKMSICRDCVIEYNKNRQRSKYFDEQITALYYGAKSVIYGKKLSAVAKQIDNGITVGSNRMGIQNFLYLFNAENGLVSSSKQMKKIFDRLETIDEIEYADEITNDTLTEGTKKTITVNSYERNPSVRRKCIEYYGYKCIVCNFDFEKNYGDIGKGYIHIHHLTPLYLIGEEYTINPIKDLVPICPNCHSMVHKKTPPYTIEEIKKILKN